MRFSLTTDFYRWPRVVVAMCAVLLIVATVFGGCGGGSRGTGSYGIGGVRPAFINEQPSTKPKRASKKSSVKAIATPTPTSMPAPSN
jgi:hypothetical protein